MENKKEKRVVQIEIDDNVKKLTITGEDKDQQVVMKEELGDDKLDQVAGGIHWPHYAVINVCKPKGK